MEKQTNQQVKDAENLTNAAIKSLKKIGTEVQEMRRLQKSYFKYRDKRTLSDAKKQEQKVDYMIEDFYNPKLF